MRKCYNDLLDSNTSADIISDLNGYANELAIKFSKESMYAAFTDFIYNPDEDIVII